MGNFQSTNTQQAVDICVQSVNSMVTNVTNSQYVSSTTTNANNVVINGKNNGCILSNNQSINSQQTVNMSLALSSLNALQSQIDTSLQNSISSLSASQQGLLSMAINSQDTNTSLSTKVSQLVEQNITSNTLNQLQAVVANLNQSTITINGDVTCTPQQPYAIQNIQSITTSQVVTIIANSLTNNSSYVSASVAAASNISTQQSSLQVGFESIVNALAKMFGSIAMAWIAIIGGVILVIGLILYGLMKAFTGGGGGEAESSDPLALFGKVLFGKKGRRRR